jgi:5-formyltetrahydrofolate cyclo-ligase
LRHDRTVRPSGSAVPGDKSDLRRLLLQRRQSLGPADLNRAGEQFAAALLPLCSPARTVAAYAAVGPEPPTALLLDSLAHLRVLLPVLRPDGDLDWAEHRPGVGLDRSARGLLEPAGARLGRDAVGDCDVVLVPALAADRAGHRLGRGGGSYDRALPRARGLLVALLHDGELLDDVPTQAHDVAVDAVVTPSGGLLRVTPRQV